MRVGLESGRPDISGEGARRYSKSGFGRKVFGSVRCLTFFWFQPYRFLAAGLPMRKGPPPGRARRRKLD